jgi:hypothetical protein
MHRRKLSCEHCPMDGGGCPVCSPQSRINWPLVAAYVVVGLVAFGGTLAALWFVEG